MKKLEYSQFGRQKCGHTIIPLNGSGGSGWGACFDDAYNMNPRGSLFLLPFSIILGPSRSLSRNHSVMRGSADSESLLRPQKSLNLQGLLWTNV